MALKIKHPPISWRNSATTTLPWAGRWSLGGQRRKILFWRRIGWGGGPQRGWLGDSCWSQSLRERLEVELLLAFLFVEWLYTIDCHSNSDSFLPSSR